MKIIKLFMFLSLFVLTLSAQEGRPTVTLNELHKLVGEVGRLSGMGRAIDSVQRLQLKNISAIWFPRLDANVQATWQSDVVSISVPFPGVTIPSPTNDQYKLTLDASQIIWDGGVTSERKSMANAQAELDKSVVGSEIYSVRERINDAFFGILLLDISEKQLRLLESELNSRINEVESRAIHGVVLQSAVNQLKAEQLKLQQRLMEIPSRRKSLVATIETLTQTKIESNAIFIVPTISVSERNEIIHPDLMQFDAQSKLLNASINLSVKKRYPTVAAFATAGYGKPGLNMISNEWDFFTVVGAKASWNIWDWNTAHRERQQMSIRKNMNSTRKMAVTDALSLKILTAEKEIEMLQKQLESDKQIIELLHQAEQETALRLLNGVASATDYLISLNAVSRANLEMEIRELSVIRERVRIAFYCGTDLN